MIHQADEEDTIYRVATPSVTKGGKGKDFILLASRRKPCDARCCYTLLNKPQTHDVLHVLSRFPIPAFILNSPAAVIAFLPPARAFIKSHDAILVCFSQGPISDRAALCHAAHSPPHRGLHQGRGALRRLHNLGRVQFCHQGWPKMRRACTLNSTLPQHDSSQLHI